MQDRICTIEPSTPHLISEVMANQQTPYRTTPEESRKYAISFGLCRESHHHHHRLAYCLYLCWLVGLVEVGWGHRQLVGGSCEQQLLNLQLAWVAYKGWSRLTDSRRRTSVRAARHTSKSNWCGSTTPIWYEGRCDRLRGGKLDSLISNVPCWQTAVKTNRDLCGLVKRHFVLISAANLNKGTVSIV